MIGFGVRRFIVAFLVLFLPIRPSKIARVTEARCGKDCGKEFPHSKVRSFEDY